MSPQPFISAGVGVAGCEESALPAVQRAADDLAPRPCIDSLLVVDVSCSKCVVLFSLFILFYFPVIRVPASEGFC